MRREESAAVWSRHLHEPRERIDHQHLRIPGAAEQFDAVAVGRVLLVTAVLARHQLARERRDRAAAREDLLEDRRADVEPRGQDLGLGHVVQVLVRDLVREHRPQLVVVGLIQQSSRHEELAAAGVGGVDPRIVHDADLDLAEGHRVVHDLEEWNHHLLEAGGLRGIDARRRRRAAGVRGSSRR
jgi:hypothetical protein